MNKFIANSFQVPNALIDDMLCQISGNACKIYLLIIRKTRGWNKEADKISYSQIQKYTGINHRATISKALDELLELGLIFVQKGNEKSMSEYRLNDGFCGSKNEPPPSSKNEPPPSSKNEPPPSSKNEPAGSKNEQEAGSKNEHTEIQYIKNTNQKNNSVYNTHTHAPTHEQGLDNLQDKNQSKKITKTASNNHSSDTIQKPDELDNQIWIDFLKVKKQRTKSDLSLSAWHRFFNQIQLAQAKTNHSLNELFEFWLCDVSWIGFDCEWYLNRLNNNPAVKQNTSNNFFDELAKMHEQELQARHQNPFGVPAIDGEYKEINP